MKSQILLVIVLITIMKANSQSTNIENWAYVTAKHKSKNFNSKQTIISSPFYLGGRNLKDNSKLKAFIKDAFELYLKRTVQIDVQVFSAHIYTFNTKEEVASHYMNKIQSEQLKLKQSSDYSLIEPLLLDWKYSKDSKFKNEVFSIYRDKWEVLKGHKKSTHLLNLTQQVSEIMELDTSRVIIKQRKLPFYDKGLLTELTFDYDKNNYLVYNIFSTKDTIFNLKNSKQIFDFIKERRPLIPDDQDIIDYLKLSVNHLFNENSRFFIITRKKLLVEDYQLSMASFNWNFTLKEPSIIYKGQDEVLVSAFVYYKKKINLAIFEINRFTGKIEMKDDHELISGIDYKVGQPYKEGYLLTK